MGGVWSKTASSGWGRVTVFTNSSNRESLINIGRLRRYWQLVVLGDENSV